MRVLGSLPITDKDSAPKFPFGATVRNETDTENGTPVIREIYGDILMNLYRLLEVTKITPTGTEDTKETQFQIIQALQRLTNVQNDIEQILSRSTNVWILPLNFGILPNKYVLFARASENYESGVLYTIKGNGTGADDLSYSFTSDGFISGDELVIVLDASGVRAYNISNSNTAPENAFPVLGNPVSFNSLSQMKYEDNGSLLTDLPSSNYLEGVIRVDVSDGTVLVNDILVIKNRIVCFCYSVASNAYFLRQFTLTDLSLSVAVTATGVFGTGTDRSPYIYADGSFIYLTNGANTSANDYSIRKLDYNASGASVTTVSTFNIDSSFVKTSNAVVKDNFLYTLTGGVLESFNLTTGVKLTLGQYNAVGRLFQLGGEVYFGVGEVAQRWEL